MIDIKALKAEAERLSSEAFGKRVEHDAAFVAFLAVKQTLAEAMVARDRAESAAKAADALAAAANVAPKALALTPEEVAALRNLKGAEDSLIHRLRRKRLVKCLERSRWSPVYYEVTELGERYLLAIKTWGEP